MEPDSYILSVEDARALLALCRTGRLYDVEAWITSGKSIRIPPGVKFGALRVAVDSSFHSMIDLIARYETSQEAKDKALLRAVSLLRLDFVEVLVRDGADIKSVPLENVLFTWLPTMFDFFIERGADVVTGTPFALALGERVRTVLRPILRLKETHPELAPELKRQLDIALRYFCAEGDLKWVSLLIWAGGPQDKRAETV